MKSGREHLPEVFTDAGTHGHLFGCLLLFADDQLVRQLLQAMFPNFIGYFSFLKSASQR